MVAGPGGGRGGGAKTLARGSQTGLQVTARRSRGRARPAPTTGAGFVPGPHVEKLSPTEGETKETAEAHAGKSARRQGATHPRRRNLDDQALADAEPPPAG